MKNYFPCGVKEVSLPTWSTVNGSDDVIWYKATRQADGTYRQHVKASDHKNSSGEYNIHLYYVQNDGTLQGAGGTTTNVEVATSTPNIPSSRVYHFTSYAAIRPEPRMSSSELAHYDVGNSVNYDRVLTADGHLWISYIGYSGNRVATSLLTSISKGVYHENTLHSFSSRRIDFSFVAGGLWR